MAEENYEAEGSTIEDPAKVLAALDRAKKDAKRFREERDALKAGSGDNVWRERAVKAEIRSRLTETGIKDTARLMKYVDSAQVEVDDDGNYVGLDDAINGLKSDFPELFDPKRRAGGKADIYGGQNAEVKESVSTKQAEHLLGR